MKKVIGVAVAASLVAGMAFADVAINLRARERLNAYHVKTLEAKDTNGYDKYTYTFDLDGKQAHGGSDVFKDDIILAATTDYAGVTVKYTTENNKQDAKAGTYNAWMKFGGLKFTFGSFDSRYVSNYAASSAEGGLIDDVYQKYGLMALGEDTKVGGKDSNNFSAVEGSRKNALVADYTFDGVAGGKALVKAGLLYDGTNAYDDEDADKTQYAGYAFEGDLSNDAVELQALVKKLDKDDMIFGVFVEPKVLPVKTAFGFTYASKKDQSYTAGGQSTTCDVAAWAVDARVQFPVNDQFTLTGIAKYENSKIKDADDADTALALGLNAAYVYSDLITAQFDVLYVNADLDDSDKAFVGGKNSKMSIRPAVKFTAGKGAAVTAALQYDNYLDKDDRETKTEYSIPVIFRVQL